MAECLLQASEYRTQIVRYIELDMKLIKTTEVVKHVRVFFALL